MRVLIALPAEIALVITDFLKGLINLWIGHGACLMPFLTVIRR
jgi:hypothetical protein